VKSGSAARTDGPGATNGNERRWIGGVEDGTARQMEQMERCDRMMGLTGSGPTDDGTGTGGSRRR
jgi:hypothetical protein